MARHFKGQRELRDSVKGVGPVTILALTAALSELGRLSLRQIFKLAGIALLADDSGLRQGKRRIWGRRAHVRASVHGRDRDLRERSEDNKRFIQG